MTPQITAEQALTYATALCNRAEYCSHEIAVKLLRKGLPDDELPEVIELLQRHRLVDDARYATAFVRQKFRNQLWGRRRIELELRRKRIPQPSITAALRQIDDDEYLAALRRIIARKKATCATPLTPRDRQAVARFAIARGFEPSLVFSLLP